MENNVFIKVTHGLTNSVVIIIDQNVMMVLIAVNALMKMILNADTGKVVFLAGKCAMDKMIVLMGQTRKTVKNTLAVNLNSNVKLVVSALL